jgi:UDP-N-acetylglucosamine 2-epimerase (non-hydrolysing)
MQALKERGEKQRLVHTGQHYDHNMSTVFFEQLNIPRPDTDLEVGSGSHADQTARLMVALESAFTETNPSLIIVYGDVNSTLAAALTAAKVGIPVAHVEAGLRSFDMTMPEEVNRKLTDQVSELLFTTSPEALANLANEGISPAKMHFTGNSMIDTLRANKSELDPAKMRSYFNIDGPYAVATVHRPSNVSKARDTRRLVEGLLDLSKTIPVILPMHPRGANNLLKAGLEQDSLLKIVEPLGYIEFMSLVLDASLVVTDSGGIQEETTVLGIACLTVRPNTERPVTITHGTNQLVEPEWIAERARAILRAHSGEEPSRLEAPPLWDGFAGQRIAKVIRGWTHLSQ